MTGKMLAASAFATLALVAAASAVRFLDSGPASSNRFSGSLPQGFNVDVAYLETGKPVQWSVSLDGPGSALPVYFVRQQSGEIFALVARDPHSGCEVEWKADYDTSQLGAAGLGAFKALCSGWVFDRSGAVLFGAAVRGLDRAPVTVSADGKFAHVDLSRFVLGLCRTDGQVGCSTTIAPVLVQTLPLPQVRDWAKAR